MRVTKTYKNCMISSKQGSDYWDVFQDGRFYATVFNEEEARSVIYKLIGENEYITDKMMVRVNHDITPRNESESFPFPENPS